MFSQSDKTRTRVTFLYGHNTVCTYLFLHILYSIDESPWLNPRTRLSALHHISSDAFQIQETLFKNSIWLTCIVGWYCFLKWSYLPERVCSPSFRTRLCLHSRSPLPFQSAQTPVAFLKSLPHLGKFQRRPARPHEVRQPPPSHICFFSCCLCLF